MCESIPNKITLYCISKDAPNILRAYDNPQEAQKALDLILDVLHDSYCECEYGIFKITLPKVETELSLR